MPNKGQVVAITQARMGSTRLPGKIMLEAAGKPLLEHHLERVSRASLVDKVVVASTTEDEEQPIIDLCETMGVPCFRGSVDDVLARYAGAADQHEADVVVRITSDCPIIDPSVIDDVVEHYLGADGELDYVSNCRLDRTFPRGMDTEVFSAESLFQAHKEATAPEDREHVTPYIWRQSDRFRLDNISFTSDQSQHRWTVDTDEDFVLVGKIIESLFPGNPGFTLEDCLSLMDDHPEWAKINRHVEQKEIG